MDLSTSIYRKVLLSLNEELKLKAYLENILGENSNYKKEVLNVETIFHIKDKTFSMVIFYKTDNHSNVIYWTIDNNHFKKILGEDDERPH